MNAPLLPSLAIASLALAAGANAGAQPEQPDPTRITRSAEGPVRDHPADELREPRSFITTRRGPDEVATKPRTEAVAGLKSAASVSYGDSWIYDATTDVFADNDGDGYYHYLRVRFDADTIHAVTDVYVEIYISADGNAWEHLYTTLDFAIWGQDPEDDYEVETELVSGYSTGLYDVLIELYDAESGELVDEYGPNESPAFSLRPLEDSERDGVILPPPAPPPPVIVDDGGGGAVSWLGLVGLFGAATLRRRSR